MKKGSNMNEKIETAYEKLKSMALFSDDFASFEAMFFELMHEGKEKEALGYVLQVTFKLLKSDGEVFNEVLARVDAAKAKELKAWIAATRGRV